MKLSPQFAMRLANNGIKRRLYWWRLQRYNEGTGNNIQSAEVRLESIRGHHVTVLAGSRVDEHCHLGSYAWIGINCTVTKAEIGRYAGIANNVSIGPGEHDLGGIANTALFEDNIYEKLTRAACVIGPDAWIGVDSVIRRGVEIGVGAIIGANTFVNANVPSFAVAAGNPARIIRHRFNPAQVEKILESRWWELDFDEARAALKELEPRVARMAGVTA